MKTIINKFKHYRSRKWLCDTYKCNYAFVGMGNHSIMNLYPVLQYLQVPIKYICCKSKDKLPLIENKYHGIKATTSIDEILDNNSIRGVFVSASPCSHFRLASKILGSGKSLFIEKPICHTSDELRKLTDIAKLHEVKVSMVGMQKRYSPLGRILAKRLRNAKVISYNYRYTTGAYPEGDVLVELFIHPLDYVTFLFGEAKISYNTRIMSDNGGVTFLLVLQHRNVTGVLELSSAYTWSDAQETLLVNTNKGTYGQHQNGNLTFQPKPNVICGIPIEKVIHKHISEEQLYKCSNFIPTLENNQIYSQGYYNEIKAFVDANEKNGHIISSLCDLFPTYRLIDELKTSRR